MSSTRDTRSKNEATDLDQTKDLTNLSYPALVKMADQERKKRVELHKSVETVSAAINDLETQNVEMLDKLQQKETELTQEHAVAQRLDQQFADQADEIEAKRAVGHEKSGAQLNALKAQFEYQCRMRQEEYLSWEEYSNVLDAKIESLKSNKAAREHQLKLAGFPKPPKDTLKDIDKNAADLFKELDRLRDLRDQWDSQIASTQESIREVNEAIQKDNLISGRISSTVSLPSLPSLSSDLGINRSFDRSVLSEFSQLAPVKGGPRHSQPGFQISSQTDSSQISSNQLDGSQPRYSLPDSARASSSHNNPSQSTSSGPNSVQPGSSEPDTVSLRSEAIQGGSHNLGNGSVQPESQSSSLQPGAGSARPETILGGPGVFEAGHFIDGSFRPGNPDSEVLEPSSSRPNIEAHRPSTLPGGPGVSESFRPDSPQAGPSQPKSFRSDTVSFRLGTPDPFALGSSESISYDSGAGAYGDGSFRPGGDSYQLGKFLELSSFQSTSEYLNPNHAHGRLRRFPKSKYGPSDAGSIQFWKREIELLRQENISIRAYVERLLSRVMSLTEFEDVLNRYHEIRDVDASTIASSNFPS